MQVCSTLRHPVIYIKAIIITLFLHQAHSFQSSKAFPLQTAYILHVYITHFISIHTTHFLNKLIKRKSKWMYLPLELLRLAYPLTFTQINLVYVAIAKSTSSIIIWPNESSYYCESRNAKHRTQAFAYISKNSVYRRNICGHKCSWWLLLIKLLRRCEV